MFNNQDEDMMMPDANKDDGDERYRSIDDAFTGFINDDPIRSDLNVYLRRAYLAAAAAGVILILCYLAWS